MTYKLRRFKHYYGILTVVLWKDYFMIKPKIQGYFDNNTHTITYVVTDPNSRNCVVIDPVLNYRANAVRTSSTSADEVVDYIKDRKLELSLILETHVHADHISAAPYLKKELGGKIAIGAHIPKVQKAFRGVFNAEEAFETDGSQFDLLIQDGEKIDIGAMTLMALHTPGHTPACMTYIIEDAAFVGDTLFMPDYGTARCDFPGGNARDLYRSIQKLYALPASTRVFLCHDYLPKGREAYQWETTIEEQKKSNIHISQSVTEDEFVAMRDARDATLDVPDLILPSVQLNMRAGYFPPPEDNGIRYLKLPLNTIGKA